MLQHNGAKKFLHFIILDLLWKNRISIKSNKVLELHHTSIWILYIIVCLDREF